MVTGMLTPNEEGYTYPKELEAELKKELDYRVHFEGFYPSTEAFIQDMTQGINMRTRTVLYLLDKYDIDFLLFMYKATDNLLHEFWSHIDPSHPLYHKEEAERLMPLYEKFFSMIDKGIGEIISKLNDEAMVLVVSDHGFGPRNKFVNLNNWLMRKGYLIPKKNPVSRAKYALFIAGFTPRFFFKLFDKTGMEKSRYRPGVRDLIYALKPRIFFSLSNMDWSKSTAYSCGAWGSGISINLSDREPQGCVEMGRYDFLKREILDKIRAFTDPETGEKVVEGAYMREKVYKGPFMEKAPDIMLLANQGYNFFQEHAFSSSRVIEETYGTTGTHRREGIFLAWGRNVTKRGEFKTVDILDIAPTVLLLFGLPIPQEMDKKPLYDIFDEDFVGKMKQGVTEKQAISRSVARLDLKRW